MLEIYFDGVLIDPDNYQELKQKWVMFEDTFKLGVTMARQFTLVIPKSIFDISTKEVIIKYMSNDYAHLIVDNYTFSEGGGLPTVTLTLVDKMVNANFNYDASGLVPCTVKDILVDICAKMGVELGTTSFTNEDVPVDFYDGSVQARTYLSYISEIAGGFARIEKDGKLYIRTFDNSIYTDLLTDLCEDILIGEQHEVKRVVFDNGLTPYKSDENEENETLYLNSENVFINNQGTFDKIVGNILNFKYCNINTGSTYILPEALVGDVLKLTYQDVDYFTICQYDEISFMGLWNGSYVLNTKSSVQEETKITTNIEAMKNIKIHLNRVDNELSIYVTKTDENTQNISDLFMSDKEIKLTVQEVVENLEDNYYTTTQTNELVNNATDGLVNTFSRAGGNNLILNSSCFFGEPNKYDYWNGNLNATEFSEAVNKRALLLQQGTVTQHFENLSAGWFSLRFGVKKIGTGLDTHCQFKINEEIFDIVADDYIEYSFQNTSGATDLSFITDTSDEYVIYDLMMNYGQDVYLPYQQAQNELKSTTVQISETIKVESNSSNTITILGANGLEGYNKTTDVLVFKQTDTGLYSSFIKSDEAEISDLIIKKVGNQVWITGM